MCFTRASDTIFVAPPHCYFYSIIFIMNILENRTDDNFETYDFLWILWISFWAFGFPAKNLCFALDSGGNRDFKSVFIIKSLNEKMVLCVV